MTKVPIDIGLLIKPVSTYRFEDVAEQLVKSSIPRFFDLLQPGGTLSQSELLLAVTCSPGLRTARVVRMSRSSDSGGLPPDQLEFEPDEIPAVGQIAVAVDTEPTRPPFST